MTRICTTCKKEYPATLEYFHKMKNGKHGLKNACKTCSNEATLNYYHENK